MKKPKISVIISTYNRKKLLKKSIKSVLSQTFKDFELIVIDDCSFDKTKELVQNFISKDNRVKYFRMKKNFGNDSQPKNVGILKAQSKYITFLDDDDCYRPDALKILYKYAEASNADIVYGDYLINKKPGWSIDFNVGTLSKRNYIAMSVVMVKRDSLLKVGGFDENIPKFKDWNLWFRLQKNGYSFMHIPIIITEVSVQKKSVSNKYKVKTDEQGNYLPTFFNPADCKIWPDKTIIGERKKLKVAIFTLTLDRIDYTKRMYELMKKTAGYDFDWFVVDQGSKDGTQEWLASINCQVKTNKKNEGIEVGWNQAIKMIKKAGDYDIVIKIDNDAEMMTSNWLDTMVDLFERNNRMVLSPYVEGLEDSPGGVLRQRLTGDSPYVMIGDRVLGIVPNLGGICFASPISLYDDFEFPKNLIGNKDYYLSKYALRNGYALFYMEELRVFHMDTTLGQKKKYPEYFKKLYKEKADIDKKREKFFSKLNK